MAYTTYNDIQLRLPNIALDEDIVNSYIEEATNWINSFTGTNFEPQTTSTSKIYSTKTLSSYVIIDYAYQVDTVEILAGRGISGDTWTVIDSLTYRITPENTNPKTAIEFNDQLGIGSPIYFTGGIANIRVTARWGFAPTVPQEIKRIALQYVIEMMRVDGVVEGRVKSERLGDASVSYDTSSGENILSKLALQLSKYRDYGDIRI